MIVQDQEKGVFDFSDLLNILALEMPDQKIPPNGLYIKNEGIEKIDDFILSLPFVNVDYNIQIYNNLAHITLNQRYSNPTKHYMEVEYCFPIQPNAVIHSFIAKFGDNTIVGKIKKKKQAQQEYDEGLKEGRTVAYGQIDDLSFDVLNIKIGNIPPKTQVNIVLEYVQQLDVVMNTFWKLIIVSHVMPRYVMQEKEQEWKTSAKLYSNLKRYETPKYTWSFNLNLTSESPIVFRESSTHKLTQGPFIKAPNFNQFKFYLAQKQNIQKDFVFTYCTEITPNYTLGITDTRVSAVVSFIPKFSQIKPNDAYNMMIKDKKPETNYQSVKGEYIFILDRSGSMQGSPIKSALEALKFFIQSLPSDCYINILSFGSNYQVMYSKSQKYSDQIIRQIFKKLDKFQANLGGTEIYQPLKFILNSEFIKNYPKQIFLLTDGGVLDTKSIIKLIQSNISTSRIHTIGIGNGVSQALIKQGANKGKGKYVFIKNSQEIAGAIVQLLQKSFTAVITDISIEFDETIIDSIVPNPKQIPFILEESPLNLYIMFNQKFDQSTKFLLKYRNPEGLQFQNSVTINVDGKTSFSFVEKMVEHKKIMALYNKKDKIKIEQDVYAAHINNIEEQIVNDSIKYQVLSPLTAFICVGDKLKDEEYGKFLGDKQASSLWSHSSGRGRGRPKSFVRGRGGGGKGCVISGKRLSSSPPKKLQKHCLMLHSPINLKKKRAANDRSIRRDRESQNQEEEEDQAEQFNQPVDKVQKSKKQTSKISQILKHQNFDGSWKSNEQLLKLLFNNNKTIQQFKSIVKNKNIDQNFAISSIITRWIELNYKTPEYSLIIRKANTWLKNQQKNMKIQKKDLDLLKKLIIN